MRIWSWLGIFGHQHFVLTFVDLPLPKPMDGFSNFQDMLTEMGFRTD